MQSKLTKPWGPYAVGTVVADNKAESDSTPGAIHVNADRFAKLHEGGFFASKEPTRPIPAEVRTSAQEEAVDPEEQPPYPEYEEDRKVLKAGEIARPWPSIEAADLPPLSDEPEKEP